MAASHPIGEVQPRERSSFFQLALDKASNPQDAAFILSDRRWFAIIAAVRSTVLDRQITTLRSLSPLEDLALTTSYTVGQLFGAPPIMPVDLEQASDEDCSIFLESLFHAGQPEFQTADVARLVETHIKAVPRSRKVRTGTPFARVMGRWPFPYASTKFAGIAEFREGLADAKRRGLHILGPDIISSFQALVDPSFRFSGHQVEQTMSVLKRWELGAPGASFLLLRAIGDYDEEIRYIRQALASLSAHLSPFARKCVAYIIEDATERPTIPAGSPANYEDRFLREYVALFAALRQRSAIDTCMAVARLYSVDPSLVAFLPWTEIARVIKADRHGTPAAAFTTMLTSGKSFQREFPMVWLQLGNGAFIGKLAKLVPVEGKTDLSGALFARIKELPSPAAAALARSVLTPSIFERVIAATQSPRVLEAHQAQGSSFSLSRIEALRNAEKRMLITSEFAEEQVAYETDQARFQTFEKKMRTARVRVPWDAIQDAIRQLFVAYPLDILRTHFGRGRDGDELSRISAYLAGELANAILFGSGTSIDQALSNNLRHGFVIPRFLRCFDDAMQAAIGSSRRELPQWEIANLAPYLGKDTEHLVEYRESINDQLKSFLDRHLTIVEHDTLDQSLRAEIQAIFEAFVRGDKVDVEQAIIAGIDRVLRDTLGRASRILGGEIKRRLKKDLSDLRVIGKKSKNVFLLSYTDLLETQLHEAFDEVRLWIGVAEDNTEPSPFRLDDLINLELASMHSSNWRRLKVSLSVFRLRATDEKSPLLDGKYFDFFQDVLHNLLSNAFRHSGLRLKTTIKLEILESAKGLTIKCVNSMSAEAFDETTKKLPHIRDRAIRDLDEGNKDNLSGFLKIRLAYQRCFGVEPAITLKLTGTLRSPLFRVKLFIPNPPEIWND